MSLRNPRPERFAQAIADGRTAGEAYLAAGYSCRYEGAVANRALELLGKSLGIFVERSEQGKPGDFAHFSDEELDAQLIQRLKAKGMNDRQIRSFLLAAHPRPANSHNEGQAA